MTTILVHPWASHRKAAGYTQLQVSGVLGCSRHYYIRLEQALFNQPPPGTCERLGKLFKVEPSQLSKEYLEYQHNTRKQFAQKYENFDVLYNYKEETHPLVHWRESQGLSRIGFCKGLCLHQDMIRNYENNKQRHVPEDLAGAVAEINWDLEALTGAVATWRIKWR